MENRRVVAGLLCLLTLGAAAGLAAAADQGVVGSWMGTITLPSAEIAVIFHLASTPEGALQATLDVPDQGAQGLPVDSVTWQDGALRLEIKFIDVVYEGKLTADGQSCEGSLVQGGTTTPLTLRRVEKVPERRRPQEPKPPYPYREEEVCFASVPGVRLAGTLTTPAEGGPFPAVVFISGSGPQDRDSSFMGHRSFFVLADYLTRRGIAVLRVDDRGVGKSIGDRAKCTSKDWADDALAAAAYLRTRGEINVKQIGLLGHSEGGIVAPMAAVQDPQVAFLVLLAAAGVPGEEVSLLQNEVIAKADGASEQDLVANRALTAAIYNLVKQEKDDAVAAERIRQVMTAELAKDSRVTKERADAQVSAILSQVLSPWFRYWVSYDPRPTLEQIKVPVLALTGEKDLQVPASQSLPVLAQALNAGGDQRATVKALPGLNHLLQTAKSGSPSEYAGIEETMSPAAMEMIADWILQVTAR
jgi:pimeloyl-ACP methyl ester carboxylesterase